MIHKKYTEKSKPMCDTNESARHFRAKNNAASSSRKHFLSLILFLFGMMVNAAQGQSNLIITGVMDGPLVGGTPKVIELYAINAIPDLSIYGLGSANNGGGSDGEEFTFPAENLAAGTYIYVATEAARFSTWFGFAPTYTHSVANNNGDDAVELFHNGAVADVFGEITHSGAGAWSYTDGWAYRTSGTSPDGATFDQGNWNFSGTNALDGESDNASAAQPFPLGSYGAPAGDSPPALSSSTPADNAAGLLEDTDITLQFNEPVQLNGTWFSIAGSISGSHTATVSGGPQEFTLNPDTDFSSGETVTVTLFASQIADVDSDDPPDTMTADLVFHFSIGSRITGIVINEINADPDPENGDANSDGTVHTSQDEFVEIYNNSGSAITLTGWTISDLTRTRHTFPDPTILEDKHALVVFGGGIPTGNFAGAQAQTASSGLLSLNNAGDTISLHDGSANVATASYGGEAGSNQSITRDPDITGTEFVKHATATGANGSLFSPGAKIDSSPFDGYTPSEETHEIFEIQGNAAASPFAGQTVKSTNNIVTAVAEAGFFMQTPTERTDGDDQTSDGIYVFTGSAPAVSVGDRVDVSGQIVEFFEFTEFANGAQVTIVGSGTLPAAVALDALTPSPNAPHSPNELERFEGMLVEVASGSIGGPSQHFSSDTLSEARVVAKPNRPFVEPGVAFPGLSGLPVWDGNPEIFELDPDKLGLPNQPLFGGTGFSATGVLGFEFGDYEFWPTHLSTNEPAVLRPVRERVSGEIIVASFNLYRLFDHNDDPAEGNRDDSVVSLPEYERRLKKLSKYIRDVLHAPEILAVQEVEKLEVLQNLADKIHTDDARFSYKPYLVEGNDVGTIDVGFLVRQPAEVVSVVQLGKNEVHSLNNKLLHDRPPLLLQVKVSGQQVLHVLNVHMRSRRNIEKEDRIRQKRQAQAESISRMVQSLQEADSTIHLIVTGDFNAFEFTDGYAHVLGQITGNPADATQALLPGTDIVNPGLANYTDSLAAAERYSFIFQGSAQTIDHMLASTSLTPFVQGVQYARGNADAPEKFIEDPETAVRSSDHDAVAMFINATSAKKKFVFLSNSDIKIDDANDSFGDMHANESIHFDKSSGSPGVHNGNLSAVEDITIEKNNRIIGDVSAGDKLHLQDNAEVTGEALENGDIADVDLPLLHFTADGPDETVAKKKSGQLAPGSYGRVKVKKGASLQLHSGTYFMRELDTDKSATLIFDVNAGPITLNITDELDIDNRVVTEISGGEANSSSVTFNLLEKGKVEISKYARVLGSIIAPNAEVHFSRGSQFRGAVSAARISVDDDVAFMHHTSVGSLPKHVIPADDEIELSGESAIPTTATLEQNYPNPFNPTTTVRFNLPEEAHVTLAIYTYTGQLVKKLVNHTLAAGQHSFKWDGTNSSNNTVAGGVYFYKLQTAEQVLTKKLVLLK